MLESPAPIGVLRTPTATQRRVVAELGRSRRRLEEATSRVRRTGRHGYSSDQYWTAAEVVEHLVLVEGSFERFLTGRWMVEVKAGRLPVSARPDELDDLELQAEPCLDLYAPTGLVAWSTVWADASIIRRRLLATLVAAYGLDWNCAVIARPGLGVRASLQQWLLWAAAYESRLASALDGAGTHRRTGRCDHLGSTAHASD